MPQFIIAGTPIDFPDSGSSPDWSPAVISFAQAVTNALNTVVGTYNVAPQTQDISVYNPGTSVDITNLNFSTALIRAVFISYAIYRTTSSANADEAGTLVAVYNPNNPATHLWEMSQSSVGHGGISFYMTDTGQLQFTTTALSGTGHTGTISFAANVLLQS